MINKTDQLRHLYTLPLCQCLELSVNCSVASMTPLKSLFFCTIVFGSLRIAVLQIFNIQIFLAFYLVFVMPIVTFHFIQIFLKSTVLILVI